MRLTEKDISYITSGANVIEIPDIVEGHKYAGQAIIKLGQLEDLLDKYKISDINELDLILNAYFSAVSKITPKLMHDLKELKDIEEELGIDLVTLLKALKNGIYVRNKDNYIEYYNNVNIGLIGIEIICVDFLSCKIEQVCKYDMYGKTWALTREELL